MDIARPDLAKRKWRSRVVKGGVIALIAAAVLAAVAMMDPSLPSVERSGVVIDTVVAGPLKREVRATGRLVAAESRVIAASVEGRIDRVLLRPGAAVNADTPILTIDNPEAHRRALESRATLVAARAELAAFRFQLDGQLLDQRARITQVESESKSMNLQEDAERQIIQMGMVSKLQFQKTQISAVQLGERSVLERERLKKLGESSLAGIRAFEAKVQVAEAIARQRDEDVRNLSVRSGLAGVLQSLSAQEGQRVELGTSLGKVARPDSLYAELKVGEVQAKDVKIGLPVRVDTRAGIVEGRVIRIDPGAIGGAVTVDAELTGNLPSGARPDLNIDAAIELSTVENALIIRRPPIGEPGDRISLYRVSADAVGIRIEVTLGAASTTHIAVSDGLKAGDQVVVSDTTAWPQSDRIRLK